MSNHGSDIVAREALKEQLRTARAALDAERQRAEVWSHALQSLTPGGSEYVDDPERCVAFLRDKFDSLHDIILKQQNALAEARAELNPVFSDETLIGAIRNLQQAHISERGNAETLERIVNIVQTKLRVESAGEQGRNLVEAITDLEMANADKSKREPCCVCPDYKHRAASGNEPPHCDGCCNADERCIHAYQPNPSTNAS